MANFPKEDGATPKKVELKPEVSGSSDSVEIPLGSLRRNPWIIATFVLAIALVVVIFMRGGLTGGAVGVDVGEKEAAAKLLSFINSQGKGEATLVSTVKEGALYKVTVNFQGQDIPVYVTLDGTSLVPQTIPLSGDGTTAPTTDSGEADPNPEVIVINVSNTPVKGKAAASVMYIEFSDYQCPYCGRHVEQSEGQIVKDYVDTGKVKMYFKDYPLEFHPNAEPAAEAARCVREQKQDDGFWKMNAKLFANQENLSSENYAKWAKEIGVDAKKFAACVNASKYAAAIAADTAYGQSVGIQGTPGFLIVKDASKVDEAALQALQVYQGGDYMVRYVKSSDGKYAGVRMSGALPYSEFKKVFDALLS